MHACDYQCGPTCTALAGPRPSPAWTACCRGSTAAAPPRQKSQAGSCCQARTPTGVQVCMWVGEGQLQDGSEIQIGKYRMTFYPSRHDIPAGA